MYGFEKLFTWPALLAAALTLPTSCVQTGCVSNADVMERMANTLITQVVKPAVQKANDELSARTASIIGGAQAIEPGYLITVEGKMVTGFEGTFELRAKGISGSLQASTQADAGQAATVSPPALRQPPGPHPAGAANNPAAGTKDGPDAPG